MTAEMLRKERERIYEQVYTYKVPDRLIVRGGIDQTFVMQYKGIDPFKGQYDLSLLEEGIRELCDLIYSDMCPIGLGRHLLSESQLMESNNWQIGANGFIQHPEVTGLMAEEYDAFIEDPLACMVEKILPRLYSGFDPDNAISTYRNLEMAKASKRDDVTALQKIIKKIADEKGYYAPPGNVNGRTVAPFDFIGDHLRGFSEISKDIRRNPNKIKDACEAVYPLLFKFGIPEKITPITQVTVPLHMPMYMREKDVENLWLPTFKKLCEQYAALGITINAFCEQDWTRLQDILLELPSGIQLRFEQGDIKQIKKRLGKKFIIGTNFPVSLLKFGSKQECIDRAKKIMDDTMEGGGVIFGFDKGNFFANDINLENYCAVLETVRDYGVYPNGGEQGCVAPLNSECFKYDKTQDEVIHSKYTFDWDDFKRSYPYAPEIVKKRFKKYDEAIMKNYLVMLA